jgi:signal peptidase I
MAFHYRGISMHGTFQPGDLLVVAPVTMKDIRCGDVVAFRWRGSTSPRQRIVHRVQAYLPEGLITRGDHCHTADPSVVTAQNLIGRVSTFERDGKTRSVLGGWRGRAWALALRLWRRVAPVVGWPYRRFRDADLLGSVWHPSLTQIHLETEAGPVIKTIHRKRTVARWWPAEGRFWCRKPYDLILTRPDAEIQSRRA